MQKTKSTTSASSQITDSSHPLSSAVTNPPVLRRPVEKLLATGFARIENYRHEDIELDVESIYYSVLENIPSGETTKRYALVISDTHNSIKYIQTIVEVANRLGIHNIFHAGDVVNQHALSEFHHFKGRFNLSLGNHDKTFTGKKELTRICDRYGFNYRCDFIRIANSKRSIILTHGNDTRLVEELILDHDFDFMIVGHYHRRLLLHNRSTNKYVINPGAFNNNPLPYRSQENIPSFVLLPLTVNKPSDIIFYQIITVDRKRDKAQQKNYHYNQYQQQQQEEPIILQGILN